MSSSWRSIGTHSFINDPSIETINKKINQDASLTDKNITLSVELVTKNAWEKVFVKDSNKVIDKKNRKAYIRPNNFERKRRYVFIRN